MQINSARPCDVTRTSLAVRSAKLAEVAAMNFNLWMAEDMKRLGQRGAGIDEQIVTHLERRLVSRTAQRSWTARPVHGDLGIVDKDIARFFD